MTRARTATTTAAAVPALLLTLTFLIGGCSLITPAPVPPGQHSCRPSSSSSDTGDGGSGSAAVLTPSGPIHAPTAAGTTQLTSGFGPRWGTMHQGLDFAGPLGTPIYAALDGRVVKAGPANGFGNWVIIDSIVDGQPVSTVYGHMTLSEIVVKEGQDVKGGDRIAGIGNEGGSTGPHLHFEYWKGGRLTGGTAVDPMTVLGGTVDTSSGSDLAGATAASGSGSSSTARGRAANCAGFGTAGGGELAAGSVPPEFDEWIRKAGSLCPGIRPPILASQLWAENQFRHGKDAPVSPAGAGGPAQFMPGTWATWGKDYDGNGTVDITSIGDAVMAQGHFMCALLDDVEKGKASGSVSGDSVELALASYNAGYGAVQRFGGIPPYAETRDYVAKIVDGAARYQSVGSAGRFVPTPGAGNGQIVDAAREHLGAPYVWGGGNTTGPTGGGFDCSGLTSYAVFAATDGAVTLPRTSEEQWTVGTEIPVDQAQPGDLVFGSWDANGRPGHVGIYTGNGQMVHAPTTGDVVKDAPLQAGMKARRVT